MRETCHCPHCGGQHPHVSRIEGPVKLCWCQWCYRMHEVPLVSGEPLPSPGFRRMTFDRPN